MVSPFDLSRTLPVGGGLLVPYFLSGSPVIKQLMQMVTMVPGQGGRFQCASPNNTTHFHTSLSLFLLVPVSEVPWLLSLSP